MNGWFIGGVVGVVIGIFLFFVGFGCELSGEGCQTYQGKAYFYSSYGLIYIINWIQEIDFFDNFQTVMIMALIYYFVQGAIIGALITSFFGLFKKKPKYSKEDDEE